MVIVKEFRVLLLVVVPSLWVIPIAAVFGDFLCCWSLVFLVFGFCPSSELQLLLRITFA